MQIQDGAVETTGSKKTKMYVLLTIMCVGLPEFALPDDGKPGC